MDPYKLIRFWEGKKDKNGNPIPALEAYLDSGGVWTIGWGTTRIDKNTPVKGGDVCTVEQAEEWLIRDCANAEKSIKNSVKVPLSENQYAALLSFVYNVGNGGFERSTLLRLLNEKHYASAADQLTNWIYDNGRKVQGLINRRNAEKDVWNGA